MTVVSSQWRRTWWSSTPDGIQLGDSPSTLTQSTNQDDVMREQSKAELLVGFCGWQCGGARAQAHQSSRW
jgi:hypothetical protein